MARRSAAPTPTEFPVIVPLTRMSASEMVYASLREAIVTRRLPGGTPLIEARLAVQFQVSKTPVREALQRLSHTGLVDYELTRGVTVHTLTAGEIRDIMEMRLLLEPMTFRQSAPRLSPEQLDTIDTVLDRAEAALASADYIVLSELNNQFLTQLYACASNHLLITWLDGLNDRRRMILLMGWDALNRSARELEEQHAILRAIREGDVELAAVRLEIHLRRFIEQVLRLTL